MYWTSAISTAGSFDQALEEVTSKLGASSPRGEYTLCLVFVSHHHRASFAEIPGRLREVLPKAALLGCSAGGVIGEAREIEQGAALSVVAAKLPEVKISSFYLDADACPSADAHPTTWENLLGVTLDEEPSFILLPDPYSFDPEALVEALDASFPETVKIGGLASGAVQPGGNALFLDDAFYQTGCVGISLSGNIQVDTIVAQGSRPIGDPMFVTRCNRNVIQEIDCRAPDEVLEQLFTGLEAGDQQLFQDSLSIGLVMRAGQQQYRQGDFLIRNILGIDSDERLLYVGAMLEENMVVQFHLRDAETSRDDLEILLTKYKEEHTATKPQAAVLFSCLGRGSFLYGTANHDSDLITQHLGNVPLGGFFCNGEIGPVHGATYVHGYTSAIALFRPRSD